MRNYLSGVNIRRCDIGSSPRFASHTHLLRAIPECKLNFGLASIKSMGVSCIGAPVFGGLPARTDTNWWVDVMTASELRFIKGRLKFDGASSTAPFPSVIAIWGTARPPTISLMGAKA